MKGFTESQFRKQVVVDVEASGPTPLEHGILQIGAVFLHGPTFRININLPDDTKADEGAMNAIGLTRDDVRAWGEDQPRAAEQFHDWLRQIGEGERVTMWSDNPAFDWMWVHSLLIRYKGSNPMGHSARRIGDFYAGYKHRVGDTQG